MEKKQKKVNHTIQESSDFFLVSFELRDFAQYLSFLPSSSLGLDCNLNIHVKYSKPHKNINSLKYMKLISSLSSIGSK